jgi:hypothetical protein
MAAVTDQRKVLSIEGKLSVIREIENGRKKKADMCQEFGLLNSMIQIFCKNRTKITSAFEWNGSRIQ